MNPIIEKEIEKFEELFGIDIVFQTPEGFRKLESPSIQSFLSSSLTRVALAVLDNVEKGLPETKSGCGCPPFQSTHEGYCWSEEYPGESIKHNSLLSQIKQHLKKEKKKFNS